MQSLSSNHKESDFELEYATNSQINYSLKPNGDYKETLH